MAFCAKCGAPVEGAFCPKCGAPVASPGASNIQAEQSVPYIPPPSQPSAPAAKKGRAIFWVLGGCLCLIVILGIMAVSTGIFVARKAGLDPALMERNPELAVAKMMASVNPDVEVLSVDESKGTIQVRDKKTGKTMTMNLKDVQKGKIVFQDDQNKNVEIQAQGEGENAGMEVRSSEGTMRMGAGSAVQLPPWLPSYPGAEAAGTFSLNSENGKAGSCSYKTGDSIEKVVWFYENALKASGLVVEKTTNKIPGAGTFAMLTGKDISTGRSAKVTAKKSEEGTTITLMFGTKTQDSMYGE